ERAEERGDIARLSELAHPGAAGGEPEQDGGGDEPDRRPRQDAGTEQPAERSGGHLLDLELEADHGRGGGAKTEKCQDARGNDAHLAPYHALVREDARHGTGEEQRRQDDSPASADRPFRKARKADPDGEREKEKNERARRGEKSVGAQVAEGDAREPHGGGLRREPDAERGARAAHGHPHGDESDLEKRQEQRHAPAGESEKERERGDGALDPNATARECAQRERHVRGE